MLFFLSVLALTATDLKKESNWLFVENHIKTKTFVGYVEMHDNVLVLSHMPAGRFPSAVVYKHELIVKKPEQKIAIQKAKDQDVAVKIAGQLSSIGGKQYIVVDSVYILSFESK